MTTAPNKGTNATTDIVCYLPRTTAVGSIWHGTNPLSFSLPLFTVQVVLVVLTTRIIVILLKPFRQPRVIAEIIGGIVLGPSVMGRVEALGVAIFPVRSRLILETIAHLGLLCFLFLIGVEMDITLIRQTGQRALVIAVAGMVLPFAISILTSFMFKNYASRSIHEGAFLLFLGVVLSVTAFPILARILVEIKLLNTEIGRISLSAAIINDMCAWILLAMSIALADSKWTMLSSLWVFIFCMGFVLACFYCVRPAMWWFMRRIPEGQAVSDFHICFILVSMMLAALTTDAIGVHSVFGAFVFGLVIPHGPIGVALMDKLEDIVTGLLLPLYFVMSGLRTDLSKVTDGKSAALLILVFVLASIGKIVGTIVISLFYTMPLHEGLSLGFLMNTRGLVEMIVLNIGRDKKVVDDESFSVLVMISLIMTAMVTPAVTYLHRPMRRFVGYNRRNLQRSRPDTELRVLACVHNTRNVPSIINLVNISNPTKRSPIFVYALHLVELTGRASAMLIVHNTKLGGNRKSAGSLTNAQAQYELIFQAFENYEQQTGGVSVQTLTIISPYTSMHEDVCNLAEDKHVALIILPFHKQQTVDGGMEPINPSIKLLNENLLKASPCSVGILIDRGLSSKSRFAAGQHRSTRLALLFFGGPDDREALAYVWRMAEHPAVNLTVVRFILPGDESTTPNSPVSLTSSSSSRVLLESRTTSKVNDSSRGDKQLDEDNLNEFRLRNANNESVVYEEKEVNNTEETVGVIRSMEGNHDLYVVGRKQSHRASTLMDGLTDWMECPELGAIGDLLASSDFSTMVSVLVVQQYVGGPLGMDGPAMDDGVGQPVQQNLNNIASQRILSMSRTHRGMLAEALHGGWRTGK